MIRAYGKRSLHFKRWYEPKPIRCLFLLIFFPFDIKYRIEINKTKLSLSLHHLFLLFLWNLILSFLSFLLFNFMLSLQFRKSLIFLFASFFFLFDDFTILWYLSLFFGGWLVIWRRRRITIRVTFMLFIYLILLWIWLDLYIGYCLMSYFILEYLLLSLVHWDTWQILMDFDLPEGLLINILAIIVHN